MEKLPAQMTVVGISKFGGPEVLLPETRSVPAPIRRRPAPAICPALKLRAKSWRWAPAQAATSSATR